MFPLPPQAATVQARALPLSQLVYALFFDPVVLLFLQRDGWRRALRLMAGFALLTGLLLGLVRLPGLYAAATDWSAWVGREVGGLQVGPAGLAWDRPSVLPYTTRHRGWRIDFLAQGTPFVLPAGGPEKRGIWVTADEIQLWYGGPGRAVLVPIMKARKLWGVLELERVFPPGTRLAGAEFTAFTRQALVMTLPVFLVQQALAVMLPVVSYTLLFALIPVLIRGARDTGGLPRSFAFYGYASIPPLLCAGIYAGLGLPFLRYDTAFVLAFVAYLMLVARAVRRALTPPEADA